MAQATHKITEFPGPDSTRESVQSHLPPEPNGSDRESTRELRNMIEDLQNTVREARRQQRHAEEEREQMRGKILDMQERMDTSGSSAQLKALIRERDVLIEQQSQYGPVIADLKARLKSSEIEAQKSAAERDAAFSNSKKAKRNLQEAEEMRSEAFRQRDAAIRQRDLAKAELDKALEKAAQQKKNFTDAQKALAEAQKALIEARQEHATAKKKGGADLSNHLDSLRHARDGMAEQIRQLKDRVSELEDQKAEIEYARDSAEKFAAECKTKLEELQAAQKISTANHESQVSAGFDAIVAELQNQLASATETNRMLADNESKLSAEIEAMRSGATDSSAQLDQTHPLLLAAQEEIEAVVRERDQLRAELAESTSALERQIQEQAAQLEELRRLLNDTQESKSSQGELESLIERRRLEMIEMGVRLENAQREIRILSADLAEARLHAKMAGRPLPHTSEGGGHAALAPVAEEITAMRRSFHTFNRDQKQLGLLGDIETQSSKLSQRTSRDGQPILHDICTTFSSLLRDLMDIPEQITQATLRTLGQSIEFMALLVADPQIEKNINLKETRVFIVDDEPTACSMIADAIGLVGLDSNHVLSPSAAIAELSSNRYDLIVLDVHLPEMDGFELSSHIRNMPLHKETPIFFVTGDASLDTRVKSSLRGANEFISKPFIVQEIALKAVKSVITSQLRTR